MNNITDNNKKEKILTKEEIFEGFINKKEKELFRSIKKRVVYMSNVI